MALALVFFLAMLNMAYRLPDCFREPAHGDATAISGSRELGHFDRQRRRERSQ